MNARTDAATLSPADSYPDAVDARTTALMAPGARFWPLSSDNLAEVFGEVDQQFFAKLGAALAFGDSRSTKGGDIVRERAEAYWKPLAAKQAVIEVDAECRDALTASLESRAEVVIWHRGMGARDSPGMA
jgi:hypothetical protein